MIAIGTANPGTAWFLEGIANLQNQQSQVQRELSSGYQVQDASDAPAQTPALVVLGSNLAQVQDYQTHLTQVQAEANTADSAIGSAVTLLQSAQTLAAQGANTTTTATGRQDEVEQIQSIQQQIVSLADTTVAGRYIFGGNNDNSAPYAYDAAAPAGVDQLTAQTSTLAVVNPSGQTIYQPLTAQQIFDPQDSTGAPTASNTFAALQSLVTALNANDIPGITSAIASLSSASTYLNQQQAHYGTAEQRITSEQNVAANQATELQTQISNIRDTNETLAATQLTQLSTDESAAYAAQAAVPVKSLFDYLG